MQAEQKKALTVGALVALICSVLVSVTVVVLKPVQDASNASERIKVITRASGISMEPEELYKELRPFMVNLKTGEYKKADDPEGWLDNYRRIIRDPEYTRPLSKSEDLAAIKIVPDEMMVFIYYKDSKPDTVIFPVYGTGLYSVLFAYIGVNLNELSVSGIKFSEQGETPGLGGEIDNPNWQKKWEHKLIYDKDMDVFLNFSKQIPAQGSADAKYHVDAISGATLTTNGVRNMVQFWFGQNGYKQFIESISRGQNE